MNAQEAVAYIDSYYPHVTVPGLHRIRPLMEKLGNPQDSLRFIHVAGTNGKGSTCAMLASVLQRAGYKTGLFTSPHLIRFNERMQINGEEIPDADLARITEQVRPVADAAPEELNEFELITAIGFTWFAEQKCDIVVCEVGLGGEFDATNVIPAPEASVICNIGLDHTALLGNTLEEIASAKAGIIKPGCPAVVYRGTEGVEKVYEDRCAALGSPLYKADFAHLASVSSSLDGQVFRCALRPDIRLSLPGDHQLRNAAVVLKTLDVLIDRGWKIPEHCIYEGLANVGWPVRFQVMQRDPVFILDGGHNPQCIESLIENLNRLLPDTYLVLLVGILADKDFSLMSGELAKIAGEFVTMTPDSKRALSGEELGRVIGSTTGKPVTVGGTIPEGIETAIRIAREKNGAVVCVGSLYLAGDVLEYFQTKKQ